MGDPGKSISGRRHEGDPGKAVQAGRRGKRLKKKL